MSDSRRLRRFSRLPSDMEGDATPRGEASPMQYVGSPPVDNSHLETAALQLRMMSRPKNTQLAYDKKVNEYYRFCDHVLPNDQFRYSLKYENVYRFFSISA